MGSGGDSSGVTSLRLNSAGLSGTVFRPERPYESDRTAPEPQLQAERDHTPTWGLNSLTNLRDLHLHSTKLSGTIPALSALTSLVNLNLSATRLLSGTIPDLSALVNLSKLKLQQNKLSGTIPQP